MTGLLTAAQNKTEWIISNTAKSNSTNLSFSSLGSRFALSEGKEREQELRGEGRRRREGGRGEKKKKRGEGRNGGRQLESSAYISKAELLCQRSRARSLALIADAQLLSLLSKPKSLPKHFRLVIVML